MQNQMPTKMKRSMRKFFSLNKKSQCLRNENKNKQAIIEMLIVKGNKNAGTWKTVKKKTST